MEKAVGDKFKIKLDGEHWASGAVVTVLSVGKKGYRSIKIEANRPVHKAHKIPFPYFINNVESAWFDNHQLTKL